MLHSDLSTPVTDRDLLLRGSSASDGLVYTFGVREDSEYGAVWPQLDENLTPEEALRSKFCRVNWIISTISPFVINLAFGFGLNHAYANIGLTNEGDPIYDSPPSSAAFIDMGVTSFCVVFLTSLFAKGAVHKGVMNAKVGPVNDLELSVGLWRFFPLRVRNHCGRSLLLAIEICSVWTTITFLFLFAMCRAGKLAGDDNTTDRCFCAMTPYIIVKSAWAGLLACLIYPLCFLPALNRASFSAQEYQEYLKQRESILSASGQLPADWPVNSSVSSFSRSIVLPPPLHTDNAAWNYQPIRS